MRRLTIEVTTAEADLLLAAISTELLTVELPAGDRDALVNLEDYIKTELRDATR